MPTWLDRRLAKDYEFKRVIKRKRRLPGEPKYKSQKAHINDVLRSAQRGALKRGHSFNLVYEDLEIPECCPYLGTPITYIRGRGRVSTNFSLNRIDSSLGYFKENIEVVSDLANRMLQDSTKEQQILFAKAILAKNKVV